MDALILGGMTLIRIRVKSWIRIRIKVLLDPDPQ
jgi:hypothetical protein